jgi:peptidoglycan hydrolase CwlO-like protein
VFEWFFALPSAVQAGIIALTGTIISVGSVLWLDHRKSSREDYRAATDAEIKSRAELVRDMANHIGTLQKDLGLVNDQLEELRQREFTQMQAMRSDMDALDRRWRHLANNLVFYNQIIIRKLRALGEKVPPFTGFRQFAQEGGNIKEEWLDHINEKDC